MNTTITIRSISIVVEIDESCGLPLSHGGFSLQRHTDIYEVTETDLVPDPETTASDRPEALEPDTFAPRPQLPANPSKLRVGPTFVCGGTRLAWVFVPELRRWTLAPAERQ